MLDSSIREIGSLYISIMDTPNYQSIGRLASIFQRSPVHLRKVFERLEIRPALRINDVEHFDLSEQQESQIALELSSEK